MKTVPVKVTHEITKNRAVTKIYGPNDKLIGTLDSKRDGFGFSRKTRKFEELYPEFLSEVDDFHCTSIATELLEFEDGTHPDLEDEWEAHEPS